MFCIATVPLHTKIPVSGISRLGNSSLDGVKSGSDSEYGGGPVSPTKGINRSRIKAVPRLGQRRTSFSVHGSASESEDDTKRNNKRIRTESVRSVCFKVQNL